MKVSEVFYSIQGEGPWMGRPCVFIRLAGCNLRCGWCDTPYASWQAAGEERTVEELLGYLSRWPRVSVVITGGEPFLSPALPALCEALRAEGRPVALESAGTLFQHLVCDLLVLSPKLKGSDPDPELYPAEAERHRRVRENQAPLRRLLQSSNPSVLKFVVSSLAEVRQSLALAEELSVGIDRVWLMPQAAEPADLLMRAPLVAAWALEAGCHYGDRLHVRLWGNVKGK